MLFLREIAMIASSSVITSVSFGSEGMMFSVISRCSDLTLSSRLALPLTSMKSSYVNSGIFISSNHFNRHLLDLSGSTNSKHWLNWRWM
jgi:hypothetical protein